MTPQSPSASSPVTQKWSWSIVRVFGIDIRVHATFLVLLGWILFSHLRAGHGVAVAGGGVLFVGVVFTVVVLHELGHALVARRFGIGTRDITLLPIGGVARLERMPTEPRQELLVAVAGPAVNVALAAVSFAVIVLLDASWSPHAIALVGGPLLAKFLWLNIGLAVFNMLPAFPMDGGRVLRAVLAMRMNRIRATDVAARVGKWMALGLGLIGLYGSPMLVLIAVFVWFGAAAEAALVHTSSALETVRVGDAMVTTFETLSAAASISHGVERAIHTSQRDFPVMDVDGLVGFVSAADLIRSASQGAGGTAVATVAHSVAEVADPNEPVETALQRLQEAREEVLPVFDAGRLVGLLVPRNVLQVAGLRERQLASAS